MEKNKLEEAIEELKTIDEAINDSIINSEEVKNGEISEEEAKTDPTYILYKQISDNTIKFFEDTAVANMFVEIGKKLGEDVSANLVQLIGMGMTQSAYNAMVFYDDVLRTFINQLFRGYSDKLSEAVINTTAIIDRIKVLNQKVSDLEKNALANNIEK